MRGGGVPAGMAAARAARDGVACWEEGMEMARWEARVRGHGPGVHWFIAVHETVENWRCMVWL